MEGWVFSIGILLAIIGPLFLLPIIWLIYRFCARALVQRYLGKTISYKAVKLIGFGASSLLVSIVLLVSWLPGKLAFERLCSNQSVPQIKGQAKVKGYFRTQLFPYQAKQILADGLFEFVEAPHPYRRGILVRYTSGSKGEFQESEIRSLNSRYMVRESHTELDHRISLTQKIIQELSSKRELARAASLSYQGGPLSLFLGSYAMEHCPDILTQQGSDDFKTFYRLEARVLGGVK